MDATLCCCHTSNLPFQSKTPSPGWLGKKMKAVRMEMVMIDMVLKESNITPTKRRNQQKHVGFNLMDHNKIIYHVTKPSPINKNTHPTTEPTNKNIAFNDTRKTRHIQSFLTSSQRWTAKTPLDGMPEDFHLPCVCPRHLQQDQLNGPRSLSI